MKAKYKEYYIKPRYQDIVFGLFGRKKVYDLIEREVGKRWCDPSYGNGGGDFIEYEDETLIESFDMLMDADQAKIEFESYNN